MVMTFLVRWGLGHTLVVCALSGVALTLSSPAEASPLALETKIPLGDIAGRIDHLAFDSARHRVYVAELGNNSVGIVDLSARRTVRTVSGFDEPQGIGYEPSTDTIYVANAGDGSVRLFRGADFSPVGRIALGEDADNVRVDPSARRVYVGYGRGALAVIDAATRTKIADIALKGHPESFQLSPTGTGIYVNIPDTGEIAVVNRDARKQTASWSTARLHANFPLAIDERGGEHVIAVFRQPARLASFDVQRGATSSVSEACTDADDVFVDSRRHQVYVICGQGVVDTFVPQGAGYGRVARIGTSPGSRTGLFVPELDRLLVAIRAAGAESAALWVFRPAP